MENVDTTGARQAESAAGGAPLAAAPTISVIVPIYNVEPYLRRCLDSICNQSYRDIEVICVDDGSTDGSLAVLREYEKQDARIRVVAKPNGGVSSARNAGLDAARGLWVAWADPDDYILPELYSTLMPHVTDGVDWLCFGVRVEVEAGTGMEAYIGGMQRYLDFDYEGIVKQDPRMLSKVGSVLWNKLYRRSHIEQQHLRFREDISKSEDVCFHLSFCAYAEQVYFCPTPFYVYILRGGSLSYSRDKAEPGIVSNILCLKAVAAIYAERQLLESYGSMFFQLMYDTNYHVTRWSCFSGEPLKWRERMLEAARECRLQKYAAVLPVIHEFEEQLRLAHKTMELLKACLPSVKQVPEPESADVFHVAIPTDEEHAGLAALLACGLRKTAAAGQELCVHFVCDGVGACTQRMLEQAGGEGVAVRIHEPETAALRDLIPLAERFPRAAYLKMLLPWLLPDVGRILVLTPGLCVRGELPSLQSVDMGGMALAALEDFPVEGRQEAADRAQVEKYVASAAIVMDLEQMRAQGCVEIWVAACMFRNRRFPQAETDSFNKAFRLRMAYLPQPWSDALCPASVAEMEEASLPMGLPMDVARLRVWTTPLPLVGAAAKSVPAPAAEQGLRIADIALQYKPLRRRYHYYRIMSKVAWGKRRRRYKEKTRTYRDLLRRIRCFFREEQRRWGI